MGSQVNGRGVLSTGPSSGRVAVSGATILLDLAFLKTFDVTMVESSFDGDFFTADDNPSKVVPVFVQLLLGLTFF